jgi:hypothetical protein
MGDRLLLERLENGGSGEDATGAAELVEVVC